MLNIYVLCEKWRSEIYASLRDYLYLYFPHLIFSLGESWYKNQHLFL